MQADANTAWCTSVKILIAIKDNMAFDRTDLCFLYYTEHSHEYMSSILSIILSFHFITPISIFLLIMNIKMKKFNPLIKTKKSLYGEDRFAS